MRRRKVQMKAYIHGAWGYKFGRLNNNSADLQLLGIRYAGSGVLLAQIAQAMVLSHKVKMRTL